MVNLISKVSKGTNMDQIYIPKKRPSFPIGTYVVIKQLETEEPTKPFFYNISSIEPLKIQLINEIFNTITQKIPYKNIIITGSFLDKGFRFNDIDILIITKEKIDTSNIKNDLEKKMEIKTHLISITNQALIKGLSTDPLFTLMLSNCISKNRIIYKAKQIINYKLLDLHLLKNQTLIGNFDILTGSEKYNLLRNLIAIEYFINKKEITKENIESTIKNIFGSIDKIKYNLIKKANFLDKYTKIYSSTKNKILKGIENESKKK